MDISHEMCEDIPVYCKEVRGRNALLFLGRSVPVRWTQTLSTSLSSWGRTGSLPGSSLRPSTEGEMALAVLDVGHA